MRIASLCCTLVAWFLASAVGSWAVAAPSSDALLPKSTKGYVAVTRAAEFQERWDKTQIGQMLADEVMQLFIEDAKKQLRDKYPAINKTLGVDFVPATLVVTDHGSGVLYPGVPKYHPVLGDP